MIEAYQAIGLSPVFRGIRRREEIGENLTQISKLARVAVRWTEALDVPVRLITIPEGALQGFTDEIFDVDHEDFAREGAIDIPGPETERLGELAAELDVFIMATAKARHPEFPGRFFNIGFVIDPRGEIVLRHHKVVPLQPREHSVTPHSVWDRWVELYGENLDAFYPVADTEIGRLGFIMANEGSYPENARGLAMNGCEVAYRGPYPGAQYYEVQNRARALDNNMYVIGNQNGPSFVEEGDSMPIDATGRRSMIVDYQGSIIGDVTSGGGAAFLSGVIDIDALRRFRVTARWNNWMKDLTTEQYRLIYDRPVFPKNLNLDRVPMRHEEYAREVTDKQIDLMRERGIWRDPSERA